MKKVAWLGLTVLLFVAMLSVSQKADARAQHKKEWDKTYMQKGSPMEKAIGMSSCNICHEGKSKKNRNAYGKALGGLLGKDEKDADKVQKAFAEVEKMHSIPDDEKSPTFGDLINEGKLPLTKDEPK